MTDPTAVAVDNLRRLCHAMIDGATTMLRHLGDDVPAEVAPPPAPEPDPDADMEIDPPLERLLFKISRNFRGVVFDQDHPNRHMIEVGARRVGLVPMPTATPRPRTITGGHPPTPSPVTPAAGLLSPVPPAAGS